MVWQDLRNGLDYDIYAQRFNAQGDRLWSSAGRVIVQMNESQINPKIDPDTLSGGVYVAWADKRNGWDYDIYAQRVDSNGVVLWNNNGLSISNSNGNQSAVDILSTTQSNGLICTWRDGRSGNYDIYAQKVLPSGEMQWLSNGLLVASSPFNQINPNISSDGADGCIIAWQDSTFNDWDVYAQKISGQGIFQWPLNGVAVSNAIEIQGHPKHVPDGNGGAIFAWQDKRANQYDIYVHHLFSNGLPTNTELSQSSNTWAVYPNPSSGDLTIDLNESMTSEIEMINALGETLGQWKVSGNWSLDFTHLPNGLYFFRDMKTGYAVRWIKR